MLYTTPDEGKVTRDDDRQARMTSLSHACCKCLNEFWYSVNGRVSQGLRGLGYIYNVFTLVVSISAFKQEILGP